MQKIILNFFLSFILSSGICFHGFTQTNKEISKTDASYGFIPQNFLQYDVILEPDKNQPEWWAGAPSVVQDKEGIFWLACRMRSPDFPRSLRGYEIRILKSIDGIHFTSVISIPRESVPIPGFERPAILIDPITNKFKLYACGPWQNKSWCIIKFDDADDPGHFIPSTARPVIQPREKKYEREITVKAYKDPFILFTNGKYHAYVTGYIRENERIFHFTSSDGESWQPVGEITEPAMDLTGWHNFFIRPASVIPLGIGYFFIYEGSHTSWYDPVYNITTGIGFTFDLHHIIDLTEAGPLAVSSTPGNFHTWRYSHWIKVQNELWIYAEVARENDSNEIRLFRMKME